MEREGIGERKGWLVLEDGTAFEGRSFGFRGAVAGEVVFYTGMTGYPESLTDPSYAGQILVSTFPLAGNYGVPEGLNGLFPPWESDRIQAAGLIVADYSFDFSHWNARMSLSEWLARSRVPGLTGIDTRTLTKMLRTRGSMLGKIQFEGSSVDFCDPNRENLVARVSTPGRSIIGKGRHRILVVDCGVKNNILRCLLKRDTSLIRVPWDYDFSQEDYDGILLSNGPGDPAMCTETIGHIRNALGGEKPIMGICLGNQLLARAAGAETYKLKFGHRSQNQPVLLCGSDTCHITSQNHGYAVLPETLPPDWIPLFVNVNDQTNEGIRHREKPFFSVQFHPEGAGGPMDTEFLFDEFIRSIEKQQNSL